MNPRPYQIKCLEGILATLATHRSALVVAPTGVGKAVILSYLAQRWPVGRVMVLAHREELINQAAAKIEHVTHSTVGVEMADRYADLGCTLFSRTKCVVSSVQTQNAGTLPRMKRFKPTDFGLLIIDEAHHATSPSYRSVIAHYCQNPDLKVVGFTATPDRADEEALGQVFDAVAFEYNLLDAINDGWLVPIHQKTVYVEGMDYSGARTTAGDINQGDIAKAQASEAVLHRMVDPIIDIAGDRKTLVFATPGFMGGKDNDEYRISERITEIFNRHRPGLADRVSQDTPKPERADIIRRFADGEIRFLVNVGVLTEGFDDPAIDVVALCRPTKSRCLFAQMVGRGTRVLPGVIDDIDIAFERRRAIGLSAKPFVEIIDCVGNSGEHKLVHTTDILAGNRSEAVIAKARKHAEENGGDVASALYEAEQEEEMERKQRAAIEAARRRAALIGKAKYTTATIDPFDVFDLRPPVERGWDVGRVASQPMVDLLKRHGIDATGMPFAKASKLIDETLRRKSDGVAGFQLASQLKAIGVEDTDMPIAKAIAMLVKARAGK